MILYPDFFKKYAVRRSEMLTSPKLAPVSKMQLPPRSVVHYIPESEVAYGPDVTEPYLVREQKLILVDTVPQLTSQRGQPKPTTMPLSKLIQDYHRRYRKTRPFKDMAQIQRDPKTLLVENYAGLGHTNKYMASMYSGYNRWYNIQATMWNKVAELTRTTDRMQYVFFTVPKIIPDVATMRKAANGMTMLLLKEMPDPDAWALVELWKWLDNDRSTSMLSALPKDKLDRVNLVFMDAGHWTFVNLALLDQWRKPTPLELKAGVKPRQGVAFADLQKRILKLLMTMQEAREAIVVPEGEVLSLATDMVDEEDQQIIEDEEQAREEAVADIGVRAPTDSARLTDSQIRELDRANQFNPLAEEHAFVETEDQTATIDAEVSKDVDSLEELNKKIIQKQVEEQETRQQDAEAVRTAEVTAPVEDLKEALTNSVIRKAEAVARHGRMSGAELNRFKRLASSFETIPNPFGEGTLGDFFPMPEGVLEIEPKKLADLPTVYDKSMLETTLVDMDTRYVRDVYKRDVVNAVMNVQKAGVAVTGYEVEPVEDAMNRYQIHTVKLAPVDGKPSTIRFRVPELDEDGSYMANGVKARLCKQRSDLPIRKVNPHRVALTSYYSKLSVSRSQLAKNDYGRWLGNQISAIGLNPSLEAVTDLRMAKVFIPSLHLPRIYTTLAMKFRSFRSNDLLFYFDHSRRERTFGADKVKQAEEMTGMVVAGQKGKNGPLLVVDKGGTFYTYKGEGDAEVVGTLPHLLGLDPSKAPNEIVDLKVFNKDIPIGMVLGYHWGLENLMNRLGVSPRRVPRGERARVADDEFALQFSDEVLVFKRGSNTAAMLMAGFLPYSQSIKNYSVYSFDSKDIYFTVMENNGVGVRYLRELEMLLDMWIDPITMDLLKEMGEPTDFLGLLIRATELLQTDWTPDETALSQMRIRGNERIAGAVYNVLASAVRSFKSRPGAAGGQVEMSPYEVWTKINTDGSVRLVEEANPIHNIKEREEVTYMGEGGRSGRSMVKRTRVFHREDEGVISEATKDSGEVGVTVSMTANPLLTSMRGLTKRYVQGETGSASLLSTSALLAPASDRDDPKRVNFVSIQQSQGIAAVGYSPTPLRTGMEQIIAHRAGDLFAAAAEKEGKVVSVTPEAILVEYDDGTTKSVELGRRFGKAAGAVVPHEVVTLFRVGDQVKAGDILSYNTGFFEPDPFNPTNVLWKAGVLTNVALLESTDTFEDSSVISETLAQQLAAQTTHIRDIVLDFSQSVSGLVKLGQDVDVESILCTIEDAVTASSRLFDADSLATLSLLAKQTPRAKYHGKVEKIEVFYHGDMEDMSESLMTIARSSDRARKAYYTSIGKKVITGAVDDSLRIGGNPLLLDQLVIRVYITGVVPAGVGDKGVLFNQLKTIFGRVMSDENMTVSGEPIGMFFGFQGISNRIVNSPIDIGTTNTLCGLGSKKMARIYRENKA